MTTKQKRFCDEFILSGGNSAAAARRAGYSERGAKVQGSKLLGRADVQGAIDSRLAEIASEKTADAKELIEFLSSTMRGEIIDEVATNSGKIVRVKNNCTSRLKAAEILCRIYGLFKREDEPKETGADLLIATLQNVYANDIQ